MLDSPASSRAAERTVKSQAAFRSISIFRRSRWTALRLCMGALSGTVMPWAARVSRVYSKAARAMPTALAAT